MRVRWGNILLAFLVIWILILIYLLVPLWHSSGQDDLAKKLLNAQNEIEKLSQENFELRSLLKKLQAEKESQDELQHDSQNKDNVEEELQSIVAKYVDGPSKGIPKLSTYSLLLNFVPTQFLKFPITYFLLQNMKWHVGKLSVI